MDRGRIKLRNETLTHLDSYLLTRGLPLPVGKVSNPGDVCVTDEVGRVLPSVGRVLQYRPQGDIEWLEMDILIDLPGQAETSIFIEPHAGESPKVQHPVTATDDGSEISLDNDISRLVVSRIGDSGNSLLRQLVIAGKSIIDATTPVDLEVVDGGGKIYRASLAGPYTVNLTHANALRTEVTIKGKHAARDGSTFLDFALRLTLCANCPDVKFEHTFYCREHREGKIPVKSMRLVMPTLMNPAASKLLRQAHHGHTWFPRAVEILENVEVVSSSVGDLDQYAAGAKGPGVSHPCAGGSVFLRNLDSLHEVWSKYPFHMRPGQGSGFRADLSISGVRGVNPIIGWKQDDFTLVTTFEHFRQLHPKSITLDENMLTYAIWPAWATPMELVAGVSKSHIFWLTGQPGALNMDQIQDRQFRWEYGYIEPVDVSFDPAWPAYCKVLDCEHFLSYQPDKYPLLENLMEPAPAAGNPSRHTYDRQPATGMFHFGDIVSADAATCTNNEDDVLVLFPLQHFLRTGQTYAWDYGKEAARHYMEVDFCEWSPDPRQHGGLIPHAGQHFIGNVYPSHQWSDGLLAYYYLSGDERARNVVVSVADNHCYWVDHVIEAVCIDGREAGMPLINLAAGYRLTRNDRYLKSAKKIIDNFFNKWIKTYGEFKYPYPQGTSDHPHRLITGYGDWSSFAGLYRLWEISGDEAFKQLAIRLLKAAIKPGSFSVNDVRGMDFYAAWALGRMTGDMDDVFQRVGPAVPMLLRRGGHPLRRLHFLKEMDERGLIDDAKVGNRAGNI